MTSYSDIGYHVAVGGIAGSIGTIISHPFDTVKIHLQNKQNFGKIMDNVKYRTFNGNLQWFYLGMKPSIVGYTIEKTFVFGVYSIIHDYFHLDENNFRHRTGDGFISGLIASPSITIFEQIKIDRQIKLETKYNLNYLLKGWKYTACRESIGFSIYFNVFHLLSKKYNKNDNDSFGYQTLKTAGIGACSAFISWIPIYPYDTNKTRIQSGGSGSLLNEFKLAHDITKKISVFYKGYHIAMLRAIPFHATCFVIWDWSKKYKTQIKNKLNFYSQNYFNFIKIIEMKY